MATLISPISYIVVGAIGAVLVLLAVCLACEIIAVALAAARFVTERNARARTNELEFTASRKQIQVIDVNNPRLDQVPSHSLSTLVS